MAKTTRTVKRAKHADYETDEVVLRIDATGQQFTDWLKPAAGWLNEGARVPVFYAPNWVSYACIGKSPTVDLKDGKGDGPTFSTFCVLALLAIFGFGRWIRSRPWWERSRLDEDVADALQPEPE